MPLPGLSLPGLPGLGQLKTTPTPVTQAIVPDVPPTTRTENLAPQNEWRFEAAFSKPYNIKLVSGQAELFGIELAPNQTYSLAGTKGVIFTWTGCTLDITGEAESEYAGQETGYAVEWLSLHGMLESVRDDPINGGPRILVVGPDHVGKSSLTRTVAAWAVKVGRTPTVVNLDSREGVLAPPGSLTATTVSSQVDVEHGFGISGISGPSAAPQKAPLVYSYPYISPLERPEVFKAVVTRMALSVTNKLEEDPQAKQGGILIDTPGPLNDPKSSYELLNHVIAEFSVNLILSIGSERLYNDLSKRYGASSARPSDEPITILRLTKPSGAVERDAAFLKSTRTQQIRRYFFGTPKEPLNPHSHAVNFADLAIFRAKPGSSTSPSTSAQTYGTNAMNDDDDDDDDDDIPYASRAAGPPPTTVSFDRVTPSLAMTGSLVAIKFCPTNSDEETVRDSPVMGYLYVADVDETRKKVRFLAPHPQRWGDRALLWGEYPEAVADLVV
nr:mrna cleavage and polyadenylation factor clp1 [Quercus suber]